jgi:Family of unknown function (DUF6578)
MGTFVWIESWQQQCCGHDFRVGSTVRWEVRQHPGGHDWVRILLGTGWSEKVFFAEDHHTDESEGVLTGVVSHISVVTCDRVLGDAAQPEARGRVLVPVPGSGRLRTVEMADSWEPEPRDPSAGWSFDGWIVELEPAEFDRH